MAVVAVIGGSGRMGTWFVNFLSENGYEIVISDKKAPSRSVRKKRSKFVRNPIQAAQLSEIVLLATPTLATRSLLNNITSHVPKTTLIVEISSVKQPLRKTIQSLTRFGAQILSLHPMFGPGARSLADKSILVAEEPPNCTPARRLLSILSEKGARIIRCTLEEHDELVATTLALPHFLNFAFIESIRKAGLPLDRLRELGGTTFKLQLLIAEALCHESPNNEVSILLDNKYNVEAFSTFAQQIHEVRRIIRRRSRVELLRRLRDDVAFVREDRLFGRAHERFAAAVEVSNFG